MVPLTVSGFQLTLKTKLERGDEAAKNLRMLIKSPVHTSRVKLLLTLFPEAQFIYIHRHPYQVFQSATHMAGRFLLLEGERNVHTHSGMYLCRFLLLVLSSSKGE